MALRDPPGVIDRTVTERGELVLRRDGEHHEIISNGTFLMDTRCGDSERLLVTAALAAHPAPGSLLLGGLGVGFSLAQALADARLDRVVVVEVEPTLVGWHGTHLASHSAGGLDDPRTELVVADVVAHLRDVSDCYDVVCLDVDNGPDWTVTGSNASLYDEAGTELLVSRLRRGGVLAVWSAAPVPAYADRLRRRFERVTVHEVPVVRGAPDVVVVAAGPVGGAPARGCTT